MRKLKLQVQMSMDGFIAGANGEMDWMIFDWSDDLSDYVTRLTDPVDTILLGRNLAEGFIPHWIAALANNEPGAKKIVETPKVVFSKTLTASPWSNTAVANGNLADEVKKLKNLKGNDMIVYGGGQLVSALIKENLIDELNLFVNPAILGKGMPIFSEVSQKQNYRLANSKQFDCGVALLSFNPIDNLN